jgi:hypothetical protein
MPSTRQYLVAGLICFISFLVFYGVTARGKIQTSDEAAVFATGVSLATRGQLAIDDFQWLQDHVNVGERGPDGHLYTKYFPGNIFSVALIYKLTARSNDKPYVWARELAPSTTGANWGLRLNAVWGALGMTALLFLVRRYFDWRTAIATVVAIGICSDWWYQSRGLFSEIGAGAFLIASLCLMSYERSYASSVALAISILFRPTNIFALPIWMVSAWRKPRAAIGSALIIMAAGTFFAWFNYIRFGSVWNFGYAGERFGGPFFKNLEGVLFSPGRSPFVYSPILLLAIPGAWLLSRKERILTLLCLMIIAAYIFTVARVFNWAGGTSWGSRLLTPTVPLFGVLLAPAIDYVWRNRLIAVAAVFLGLAGLGVQVLALLRDPMRVMMEHVATGEIDNQETLHTLRNSWLALQIRSMPTWQPCELDAALLRQSLVDCPP